MTQKNSNIDSTILYDAMVYFKSLGYEFISVPMLVDHDIVGITLPEGRKAKWHNGKCYVGSAEQSIYQLLKEGKKLPPKLLAITPCQRDEDVLDETHLKLFLKIELVCTDESFVYEQIYDDVYNFCRRHTPADTISKIEFDDGSIDIEINGIEIGSYGSRTYNGYTIHYGTGLALPRFTQAISK